MSEPVLTPRRIPAVPLTDEAFQPFGEVVAHTGSARRRMLQVPFAHVGVSLSPGLWVTRVDQAVAAPCRILEMERHPYSAQTFIPITDTPYLVVVAAGGDAPDPFSVQAFIASGRQGVCYAPGVWHAGLSALQAPAEFAVMMAAKKNDGSDDEFRPLPTAIEVVLQPYSPSLRS